MVYQFDYQKEYGPGSDDSPKALSSSDRVRQAIEHAILTHQLKPRERLVERDLVEQFSLSRTPIREALTRLEAVGLITSEGKRGYTVRDFTTREVLDLYYLREALERAAIPLVIRNVTDDDIEECSRINERFREAWRERDIHKMIEVNSTFHKRLLHISGNAFLCDALEQVRMKVFVCRYSLFVLQPVSEKSFTDHDHMIAALRARDSTRYEDLVISHMSAGKERYLELAALKR